MNNRKYFEFDNPAFFRTTLTLIAPIILQQLITRGVNFLDNIMIGGFGEASIAGVSFSNSFYSIFQFICMGLGSGAVVLSSQFWGQKDQKALKASAAIAIQVTFAICVAFTLFSVIAPQVILGLYTNQSAVIEAGTPYLRLLGTTFLLSGLSSTATYMLRSTGAVNIPLIGSAVAFFTNIFFNWIFIFGKLGAPRLEILGAAVGTVIARIFEFAIVFGYFALKDSNLNFRPLDIFSRGGSLWKQYIHFAVPVLISDTLLGLSLSIIQSIYGHVGAPMSAASAMVGSFVQMLTTVNIAMAGASAILVGNTIGAGDIPQAKRQSNTYLMIALISGILMIPILLLIQSPYLALYSVADETLVIARKMFLCNSLTIPLEAVAYVISKGILRGGGDTRFLLAADSTLVWVVSIPLGYMAALVWHLDPFWIYFLARVEFPAKGLVCLARYATGKWIKVIKAS